jgi:hypothetical protein
VGAVDRGGDEGGGRGGGGVEWRRNTRLLLLHFYVIPFSKHLGKRICCTAVKFIVPY